MASPALDFPEDLPAQGIPGDLDGKAERGAIEGQRRKIPHDLADYVRHSIIATTKFYFTFNGKQELLERVWAPEMPEIETPGSIEVDSDRGR